MGPEVAADTRGAGRAVFLKLAVASKNHGQS
jgi:hypothetical protein